MSLTVNIMTATLAPGDAIGNYILTQTAILRRWGVRVRLFADTVIAGYAETALPSHLYQPTGQDILWFHYSIYADNIAIAQASPDVKVMDFHGISPPRLFTGLNPYLEDLCQRGLDMLPHLAKTFAANVVHSDYAAQELIKQGFAESRIHKLPLVVDLERFGTAEPPPERLDSLLGQLEYLLFVGRLVPQKDILALIEIFAAVHRQRPDTVLVLVGSAALSSRYEAQIERAIQKHQLANRVLLLGQENNPKLLAQIFRHARFLLITSEWESFCVPLVEAMYFGVPPVVHHIPPLPEVGGEAAVVIDKHQPQTAASEICRLLDDTAAYAQLQTAARTRAIQFTTPALEAQMLATLQKIFHHPQLPTTI